MIAGAVGIPPWLGLSAMAQADPGSDPSSDPSSDADALFKAGKFEQAGRAYEEILKADPTNLRAARQRGYVGLLSNRFPEAEKYLKLALELAPEDKEANKLLGDCYIRQDKFSLSVPCWQAIGDEASAKWFGAIRGDAYQINGDVGRVRIEQMDPIPQVEVSLNGGPAKSLGFYTGAPWLGVSLAAAEEAGLRPVYQEQSDADGTPVRSYYGVLDSFRLGDIELRNVPVAWDDSPNQTSDGLIGTWVFYHLLTTFDYAGRSLILRRPTPEATRKVRADAAQAGVKPLPLWLAFDHMLHSVGSVAGSGSRVVATPIGGNGEAAAHLPGETVKQLGIRTDYDRPIETAAHSHDVVAYPCYPTTIRLGDAVAEEIYCETTPQMALTQPYGFDVWVHFAHCFYKPYNITVDFTGMNLYIARGKAS